MNLKNLAVVLALIGLAVSIYLGGIKLSGGTYVCGVSSCSVVNSSRYSEFLTIPVAIWGAGYYLIIIGLVLLARVRLLVFATFAGLVFSAYLTYLEAFVIHAWCQWCILSAWIAICLFVIALRNAKT